MLPLHALFWPSNDKIHQVIRSPKFYYIEQNDYLNDIL